MKSLPKITKNTEVFLYHKFCSCHDDWSVLFRFLAENRSPMKNYHPRRVELNPEWLEEAKRLEVELPAVVFEGEERIIMTFSEFERLYLKSKEPNKIKDKKNASAKEKANKKASGKDEKENRAS